MKQKQIDELISCLEEDRKVFFYYKDRYASLLMNEILLYENDIREIKKSAFSKLLNIPSVKKFTSLYAGSGLIPTDAICYDWENETFPFTVTYSQWGEKYECSQTSRNGFNLVIQLNFSNYHNELYHKLYKPNRHARFNFGGHPVLYYGNDKKAPETLAWARVDFDPSLQSALIEEVQTDWLRTARNELNRILKLEQNDRKVKLWATDASVEDVKMYLETVLKPYEKLWSEAMLTAVIDTLLNEVGVDEIYYHTHKSGGVIKKIKWTQPPRSLYTTLPKKFCFKQVEHGPDFIESSRKFKKLRRLHPYLKWQKLNIKGEFDVKKKIQSAAKQAA